MEKQKLKDKLREEIKLIPLDELDYILGRYCGPYNVLLCEKKYGSGSHQYLEKIVKEQIMLRSFEEVVLADTE